MIDGLEQSRPKPLMNLESAVDNGGGDLVLSHISRDGEFHGAEE
jgi:hypothetical protein